MMPFKTQTLMVPNHPHSKEGKPPFNPSPHATRQDHNSGYLERRQPQGSSQS